MEINFLKKKKKFKKGGLGISPKTYWRYIFCIFVLFVLSSSIFGLYLFLKINKEPVSLNIKTDQEETTRKEKLKEVLDSFKEREKKSIEILNSPSPVGDPSI